MKNRKKDQNERLFLWSSCRLCPVCNVIAEVQSLKEPIQSVKGALGLWKMKDNDREILWRKLRTESETMFTGFDSEFQAPTLEQIKALKKEKKRKREETRDEREAMRQTKKLMKCPLFTHMLDEFSTSWSARQPVAGKSP